ncbi:MAG: arsenosugar biosynthesis radical SAM (seleno)protein ArsS [Bacteroidota bacterium]
MQPLRVLSPAVARTLKQRPEHGGQRPLPNGKRPKRSASIAARQAPLAAPAEQLRVLRAPELTGGPTGTGNFGADLEASGWLPLRPAPLEIFQVNIGKLCNMVCRHCHVDSGPDRTEENMDREAVDACLAAIDHILAADASEGGGHLHTVDITGGAPELNPHFPYFVEACVQRGLHVIDRCNLTILRVKKYRHLPAWFAERGVEVACSLPHYRELNTDAQRGGGTYRKSIEAIRALNAAGYGQGDPKRVLTLVTNPVGAFLAGGQASMEPEWKAALKKHHDVTFDRLFALNNMPISRYLEWLMEKGQVEAYLTRLVNAFNPAAIGGLMCRNTISVSWDGRLFDCDFNQMLDMEADVEAQDPNIRHDTDRMHLRDFNLQAWQARSVRVARHCYGCTAGAGSSCGGATA